MLPAPESSGDSIAYRDAAGKHEFVDNNCWFGSICPTQDSAKAQVWRVKIPYPTSNSIAYQVPFCFLIN